MRHNTPRRLQSDGWQSTDTRPTPEQWGFIAQQLGELTPDTMGVRRP